MFDQRDIKRMVQTGIALGTIATVVLTAATVAGLAIRVFCLTAWGGC